MLKLFKSQNTWYHLEIYTLVIVSHWVTALNGVNEGRVCKEKGWAGPQHALICIRDWAGSRYDQAKANMGDIMSLISSWWEHTGVRSGITSEVSLGIPPVEPPKSEFLLWGKRQALWSDCGVLVSELGLLSGQDGAVDSMLKCS